MASHGGDLDVTPEEMDRISKALKDEKFRQLFCEYAQEISDPENRRKYEEEIAQLERNRGTDVVFVHPEPGYVLKTNVDGQRKAFVNVCKSDKVARPSAADQVRRENGQLGTRWSVPHSLAPGKEDLDKGGQKCTVYDCVFHPDCFGHAERDRRFYKLMDDTALQSIESNFGVQLDRANVKRMGKLKFKGQPRPTVIRTKSEDGPSGETDALKDFNVEYPYSKDPGTNSNKGRTKAETGNPPAKSATAISGDRNAAKVPAGPAVPKHSVVHRGHFDLQHFTNAPDAMPSTRPQELVVKVELPLLRSVATVQLEVFRRRLLLECRRPAAYRLDLALPYPVDEEKGSAKFDKSKSCLSITLPVLAPEIPRLPSFAPEPSLVEEVPSTEEAGRNPDEASTPSEAAPSPEDDDVGDATETTAKEVVTNFSAEEAGGVGQESRTPDDRPNEGAASNPGPKVPGESVISSSVQAEATPGNCPPYTFRQDESTVSVILQVAGIDADSLRKQISDDASTVSLTFRSKTGVEGATASYSLCLAFGSQCRVEDAQVDVQATEGALLLHKAASSRGDWTGFKAGTSMEDLEDKLFLTEENVRGHIEEMTRKRKGKQPGLVASGKVDCGVIEASEKKLVIELEEKENKGELENAMSDAALGTVTDSVIDSVIGELANTAASLKLDLGPESSSSSSPGSDVSSPSTPCSPSGLRSALRDGRHGQSCQRSVSFSEDVVVETMVSGHSPRKARGRNKRQPPPPRPRRFITKLRDNSQQQQGTCSDSEVHYGRRSKVGGAAAAAEAEEDFQEEVAFPDWVLNDRAATSSDSSGGEGGSTAAAADTKMKKKPKASKRQRKKMNTAKRAMATDEDSGWMRESWFEAQPPLRPASSDSCLATSSGSMSPAAKTAKAAKSLAFDRNQNHKQRPGNADGHAASPKLDPGKEEVSKGMNGQEEEAKVSLELQNHRTQSAVAFSNQVMFELDE